MRTKNLLVTFVTLAIVLTFVASAISAYDSSKPVTWIANDVAIRVNGEFAQPGDNVAVIAGDTISVKVTFDSALSAEDVRLIARIEGRKNDVDARTNSFNIEAGKRYTKTLSLVVPNDLRSSELSEVVDLSVEIRGKSVEVYSSGDSVETEVEGIELTVQRDSFNVDVLSIETPQSVDAGEMLPVDVVLKNVGYNNLEDVFVTVEIPTLGLVRSSYFGDLVAVECNDRDNDVIETSDGYIERDCNEDDKDSLVGRLYLEVPENAEEGIYTVEVSASNEDTVTDATKQVVIKNEFAESAVILTATGKTVNAGENAEYSVLLVNPTNSLKVYRVVPEATGDLSVGASESVVAIPAGSSKTVTVMASSDSVGTYNFNVNVFSDEELLNTSALSLTVEGRAGLANPVTVLTVILAIVFIVLLIVLFVLVGKKPEKSDEFGESYY